MIRSRRILLINPNSSEAITRALAAEARRILDGRAEIVAVTAPFGPASIECRAELVIAAHAVLAAIAAQRDYDAVVIAAFGDPGLEAAEDIADAPVFGLGRSGLRAAAANGRRFAIVTLGERLWPAIERMVVAEGLAAQCVGIRFLDGSVLDVAAQRPRFLDAMAAAANGCRNDHGAQAVLFGGAPFAGAGRDLAGRVAAPVFDGLSSALEAALQAPATVSRGDRGRMAISRKPSTGVEEPLSARIHAFLHSDFDDPATPN